MIFLLYYAFIISSQLAVQLFGIYTHHNSLYPFPQWLCIKDESCICQERCWLLGLPISVGRKTGPCWGKWEDWWDSWQDSSIVLFHKGRSGERANPCKFLYCLSFLIISVMMLIHWSLESGRLKNHRGGVSAHKFSVHTSTWP